MSNLTDLNHSFKKFGDEFNMIKHRVETMKDDLPGMMR